MLSEKTSSTSTLCKSCQRTTKQTNTTKHKATQNIIWSCMIEVIFAFIDSSDACLAERSCSSNVLNVSWCASRAFCSRSHCSLLGRTQPTSGISTGIPTHNTRPTLSLVGYELCKGSANSIRCRKSTKCRKSTRNFPPSPNSWLCLTSHQRF